MTFRITATTELQAVNTLLSIIGEAPINTITNQTGVDVAQAIQILDETNGWGVDRFFECSGAVKAYEAIFSCCSPGAHVVLIGNNAEPVPMNWAILFAKGLEYQTVHRYSHQYEPSIRLLGSGKIDVKPMITHTFKFEESVEAFERAAEHRPTDVKLQIKIDEEN